MSYKSNLKAKYTSSYSGNK